MVWYGTVRYSTVWYGMERYGMVWYGMVWYGMVWYGMVWYGMVWYGVVWYRVVWYGMVSGAIIGNGDRKSWDTRGPMIWDNFSIFRTDCAILTSYIHARVVVSRVDVVTLRDQILRILLVSLADFLLRWQGIRNQGSSIYFYATSS